MIKTEGVHLDCNFEASLDEEKEVLHILDKMEDKPFRSVTNAVEDIVPFILKKFRAFGQLEKRNVIYRIVCYGTDGEIAEFLPFVYRFQYVPKDSELVYPEYKRLMEEMYS